MSEISNNLIGGYDPAIYNERIAREIEGWKEKPVNAMRFPGIFVDREGKGKWTYPNYHESPSDLLRAIETANDKEGAWGLMFTDDQGSSTAGMTGFDEAGFSGKGRIMKALYTALCAYLHSKGKAEPEPIPHAESYPLGLRVEIQEDEEKLCMCRVPRLSDDGYCGKCQGRILPPNIGTLGTTPDYGDNIG